MSGFEQNPVAVSSAALLRAAHVGGWTTKGELATLAGKLPNHIARDLGTLEKAGLLIQKTDASDPRPIVLTDEGLAQLAALDRAANLDAATGDTVLPGELLLLHHQMEPDPDNPRTGIEAADAEEGLDELRESIVQTMPDGEIRGLLQNLTVRPIPGDDGRFYVTGGNRRWHAVGQAISDGDWPEDRPIRCRLRDEGAQASLETALIENKQRADMHPLDEAAAYARLRDEFGLKTVQISQRLSVQMKVIQNRLRLMDLDDDARARMRLPEDHDDRLTYKAALKSLQTPREPDSSPTLSAISPPPVAAPAPFGERITDKEALIIVEVATFIADNPDPDLPGYARLGIYQVSQGPAASLVAKSVLGFRYMGTKAWVTLRRISTDAGVWLAGLGFDDHRADVLFEMRTRVHGADQAAALAAAGEYATDWLNPVFEPSSTVPAGDPFAPGIGSSILGNHLKSDEEFAAAETRLDAALDKLADEARSEQPALIEETDDEKAARIQAARRAVEAADDDRALATFTGWMRDKMAQKRAQGASGWQDPKQCEVKDLAAHLVGHVGKGDPVDIALFAMMLGIRAGAMNAPGYLRSMTTPQMARLMIEARCPVRDLAQGPEEPDPVEDFVEAELDDEEADAGGVMTNVAFTPGPGDPAVPIRKSIAPDFIVCLEDGRKFKSLKRHLRVKYDLSPEQYRAKWGLPRDYPMVAPNYAKTRADLARQMGLHQ